MQINNLTNMQYLGDGVYIGYYLGTLWLVTSNGLELTNEICLEDEVLSAFNDYLMIQGKKEE